MKVGQSLWIIFFHHLFFWKEIGCLRDWATSYSLPSEHLLERGSLLKTLPNLTKEWRVSFEFNPMNYNYKGYAQILQMTTGGKYGNIGDRTPALWMHPSRGVYISTTLNGNHGIGKSFPTKKPPINQWTTVEIKQSREGLDYKFSLVLNGETLWSVRNSDPRDFSAVQVYFSSSWYVAQAGSIRNLRIETMTPGQN